MRPSCCKAVTPSSRPISSMIFPSLSFSTVMPVNFILRPVLAGKDPTRKSLNAGPVCVPPPSAADDVVTFRDKIRSAPEVQIRERLSEVRHERLDVFPASARFVERIPQEHVGCSEFIDNSEVASLAPEIRKPPANNGLVIFFLRHDHFSCCVFGCCPP